MPMSYSDQFYLIDPFAPPAAGTALNVLSLELTDQNDDGTIGRGQGDIVDGSLVTASFPGDTVTVSIAGSGNVTVIGSTFYLEDGRRVFTPTDGTVLQPGTFVSSTAVSGNTPTPVLSLGPPCFVAGTMIQTEDGEKPVESLTPSDVVLSHEGEGISLRLLLNRTINAGELARNPKLRPVRIMAGTMGNGLPKRDLLVSRQHRVFMKSKIAKRMFGRAEVLIPAIKLTSLPGIFVDETVQSVEYYHILFDKHEVIISEGAPTESLFTGPEALKAISPEARDEIIELFPEVQDIDYKAEPAFYIPTGREQKQLVASHLASEIPIS
ncbi:Hint domain-containing protein [Paracoccus sp. R86501]|uniref:Hint domain-containing protein n=1 Tax=Paracoccus sp. R86501 TaxID=3101711 RepID=UPI00366AC483